MAYGASHGRCSLGWILFLMFLAEGTLLGISRMRFPGPFLHLTPGWVFICCVMMLFLGLSLGNGTALKRAVPLLFSMVAITLSWFPGKGRGAMDSGQEHTVRRVVLIVVDTLRSDALDHEMWTPRMTKFAREGIRLDEAISPAPWTLPSVASFMTGVSPIVHLATTAYGCLPDELYTLAERLKEHGYATGAIGDNLVLAAPSGLDQGFQEYHFLQRSSRVSQYNFGARMVEKLFPEKVGVGRTSDHVALASCSWLRRHREKDFFLWIHLIDPHLPYAPPPSHQPQETPPGSVGRTFNRLDGIRSGFWTPHPGERQWIERLYWGEVAYVDECVGWILDELRSLNLYDETLIVLTSDHGEEFWEHDGFEHGHTLYDEVLRVPLVFKLPAGMGERGGDRIEAPVTTESMVPTLMDLLEIPYDPRDFSSPSLASLLLSRHAAPPREPILSTGLYVFEDRVSLRFGGKKYIRHLMSGKEELYDLAQDKEEQRCVARKDDSSVEEGRILLSQAMARMEEMRDVYGIHSMARGTMTHQRAEQLKKLGYLK